MHRFFVACLLLSCSHAAAQTDHAAVAIKSRADQKARLDSCWGRITPQNLPADQTADAVLKCARGILTFSASQSEGKPQLTAVMVQKSEIGRPTEIGFSLACEPNWSLVSFTVLEEPTVSDKLESKVAVSYKIGSSQPKTEWWNLRNGTAAVATGEIATRFINEMRQGRQAEVLVELLTPHKRLQASYKIENILEYRELHLKYCR